MGSLEELLSNINSGAVDVTASAAAAKRQPRKPKAQTDLQKRLRGQAGAVNTTGSQPAPAATSKAAERRAAARGTPTPPPAAAAAAVTAAAPSAGAGAAVAAAAAPAAAAAAAPAGPPPLAADAPLTMRLKRVLDLLRLNRDPHTFADIRSKLHVDLALDSELLDSLQSHSHVAFDSLRNTLRYRPKIPGIDNANELLNYLRRNTTVEGASSAVPMTGVRVADVADAYIGVANDIKRLQAEGYVYVFGSTGQAGDTLYAVQNMNIGLISEDVVELFHNTKLPLDTLELQWRVRDLGLKSALAARPVRKKDDGEGGKDGKGKKKRRKIERKFNVDKATNAHMRELFEGAQPKNIETR